MRREVWERDTWAEGGEKERERYKAIVKGYGEKICKFRASERKLSSHTHTWSQNFNLISLLNKKEKKKSSPFLLDFWEEKKVTKCVWNEKGMKLSVSFTYTKSTGTLVCTGLVQIRNFWKGIHASFNYLSSWHGTPKYSQAMGHLSRCRWFESRL